MGGGYGGSAMSPQHQRMLLQQQQMQQQQAQQAHQQQHMSHDFGGSFGEDDVSQFLQEAGVDEMAISVFQSQKPEVQRAVMAKGSLLGAKNTSSALISRVRQCSRMASSGPGMGGDMGYGSGGMG